MDSQIPYERDEARADEVPRRFVLPGKRLPGLLVLAVLPLAAILGLTGIQSTVELEQDGVSVQIDYPRVQRFLNPRTMSVVVTNTGSEPLTDLHVRVARDFADAYAEVAMMPGEAFMDSTALVVPLDDLAPGETRGLRAELRSHTYWSHGGAVTVQADNLELTADLRSLVLP